MLDSLKLITKEHTIRIRKRYDCKNCKYIFHRFNKETFTVNPLDAVAFNKLRDEAAEKVNKKVRACPKCKTDNKPS